MTTIKQGENKFYIGDEEENPIAELTFTLSNGNEIIVDHTYVSDELRGNGVAGMLVEKVVNYAREEGKTINPKCSYTKNKMEKTPEYHDVLSKQ